MAGEEAPDDPAPQSVDREDFTPRDFEELSLEDWEDEFDPDTWITGPALLDRVEGELRGRIASREVFAVLERITNDGQDCVLAYADDGYALVRPTGEVEGFGTVLHDVKPTVALCSMPDYEPESVPSDVGRLPTPAEVEAGRGDLGNKMLQATATMLVLAGLALLGAWMFVGVPLLGAVVGMGFVLVAVFLLFTVANARLSERYRAEEYRDRLRSVGLGEGERPPFLPVDESATEDPESGVD